MSLRNSMYFGTYGFGDMRARRVKDLVLAMRDSSTAESEECSESGHVETNAKRLKCKSKVSNLLDLLVLALPHEAAAAASTADQLKL